ncbi:MAG: flavin reductase family protein [Anaerolineales bacterium]
MDVQAEQLRDAMRLWSSGVTVVTARYNGVQHGMTVSSFTSLSLQPPLVMVSLRSDTRTREMIAYSRTFGVTILSAQQREVSNRFAGRIPESANRFQGLETFTLESDVPFLRGGMAFFDCRVVATYQAGTHHLLIAQVLAVQTDETQQPLLYFNRDYRRLCDVNE